MNTELGALLFCVFVLDQFKYSAATGAQCAAVRLSLTNKCTLLTHSDSPQKDTLDKYSKGTMYYAQRTCLPKESEGACPQDRQWSFERFTNLEVVKELVADLVLETVGLQTVQGCMSRCLVIECKALLYNKHNGQCTLLTAGPNSVRSITDYFKKSDQTDLFESSCAIKGSLVNRKCDFLPTQSAGMVDVYDELFENVLEAADFSLQCQRDSMMIEGSSLRLLQASIQPRLSGTDQRCQLNVQHTNMFSTKMSYEHCGMQRMNDQGAVVYKNLLLLKDAGSELITIRDKMVNALCRINSLQDIAISYGFDVEGNGTLFTPSDDSPALIVPNRRRRPLNVTPKFNLQVLDKNEHFADEISVGDVGYLKVTTNYEQDDVDFEVSDVVMQDMEGHVITQLYDQDGCPSHVDLEEPMRRHHDGSIRARIKFEHPLHIGKKRVVFTGLVKACKPVCYSPCLLGTRRSTREVVSSASSERASPDLIAEQSARSFDLEQELYSVRQSVQVQSKYVPIGIANITEYTNRAVRLPELLNLLRPRERPSSSEKEGANNKVQVHSGPLSQCLTQRASCAMTVLLTVLQAVLVALCICMVYMYVKQVQRNRFIAQLDRHSRQLAVQSANHNPPPDYADVCPTKTNPPAQTETANNAQS